MFKHIAPVLALGSITLAISATKDGQIQVAFIQKPNEGNKVPIPPRCWTGTAEELDACVAPELAELVNYRTTTVADGLAEAKKAMDDALAAEKAEAEKRKAKPAKAGVTKVVPGVGATKPAPALNATDEDDDGNGDGNSGGSSGANADDSPTVTPAPLIAAASTSTSAAQAGGLFD